MVDFARRKGQRPRWDKDCHRCKGPLYRDEQVYCLWRQAPNDLIARVILCPGCFADPLSEWWLLGIWVAAARN